MRIFVYEFTCATRSAPFLDSLRSEGWAMLSAIVDDFGRIPGVEVLALLHSDVQIDNPDSAFVRVDPNYEESRFQEMAGKADLTLVIAPEIDNILAQRCEWVKEAGGHLLGSSLPAVRLAADKYALGQHLKQYNIPTPECRLFDSLSVESPRPFPGVVKPRLGAGSLKTYLFRSHGELADLARTTNSHSRPSDWIVQPFVSGQAASVAFLIGPKHRFALPPASQNLSDDGRFHYLGGSVPIPNELAERAQRLASRAVASVPGLRGYVGVDLVLGPRADGSEDWIIEINPRLTTSYIGLRALAESNLAETMLAVSLAKEPQPLKWGSGQVHFHSDSKVFNQ
jgi:predicted ATP-grasp superfamily ATP-dependent carboligase